MFDEERPYEVVPDGSTQQTREEAWSIGAGLQRIDGLEPTPLAYELANEYIVGKSTYQEISQKIEKHYEQQEGASPQSEADISAIRIMEIVQQNGFTLSPAYLAAIHGKIFKGLLPERKWEGELAH